MSYDMAFKGELLYRDPRSAKQALAQLRAYECLDDSVIGPDEVVLAGDRVRVECFTSAPASMWESTCGAIETLAELAIGGHVNAQYDPGEGEASITRLRYLPTGDEEELDGPFPDGMEPDRDAAPGR